ncbi:unnamed protein product, partial [Hapterophycus canaliculatus]
MISAGLGNAKIAKCLVERGANLDICNNRFASIHTATTCNAADVVRVLVDAGADVSTGDAAGRTPLMMACSLDTNLINKRRHIVSLLLQAGADCTARDTDGVTALHSAASGGDPRVIDLLLSKAPSTLNQTSYDGMTPLYVAAQFGHTHVLEHLLSAGSNNKAAIGQQACPLRVAMDQGHDDAVRVLLT